SSAEVELRDRLGEGDAVVLEHQPERQAGREGLGNAVLAGDEHERLPGVHAAELADEGLADVRDKPAGFDLVDDAEEVQVAVGRELVTDAVRLAEGQVDVGEERDLELRVGEDAVEAFAEVD